MTDDDKVTVEEALRVAFEAGRAAAQSEEPDRFRFQNGEFGSARGNLQEYEDAIRAKTFELRGKGVRRVGDHPEILAIKQEYGRE